MTKMIALLMGASALVAFGAAGTASAATAPALSGKGTVHKVISHLPGAYTLYDQNDNDSGTGIVSDNFDSGSFPSYTDQAADDFTVPAGETWRIREVDVTGVYFNGYGPSDGQNVFFYQDDGGLPGTQVAEIDNLNGTDNGFGSFAIRLRKNGNKYPVVKLSGGDSGATYWVSVQANMNYAGGAGEWGWEVRSVQSGNPAAWQNPGGGFAVCPSWATLQSCLGFGPDLMFAIQGKSAAHS